MNKLLPFFLLLILFSCNGNKPESIKEANTKFSLPDKLFKFKPGKKITLIDWNFNSDVQKQKLVELDSLQKLKLLAPLGTINDLPYNYFTTEFVSKLGKTGSFSPIILSMNADDYSGLYYVLLDSNLKPVSYYKLYGGSCAGPGMVSDSIIERCPTKTSIINTKGISSFEINEVVHLKKGTSTIDSTCYFTKILSSGKMVTTKTSSKRYERRTIE